MGGAPTGDFLGGVAEASKNGFLRDFSGETKVEVAFGTGWSCWALGDEGVLGSSRGLATVVFGDVPEVEGEWPWTPTILTDVGVVANGARSC